MIDLDRETLVKMIDHTELSAHSGEKKIANLCSEARTFGFYTVCINGGYTRYAFEKLAGSGVLVCTVVGFPLGAGTSTAKAFEAREAVANGAAEIDMVVNVGALRDKKLDYVRDDIRAVVDASGPALVKVILETCFLTDEEIVAGCELSVAGRGEVRQDLHRLRRLRRLPRPRAPDAPDRRPRHRRQGLGRHPQLQGRLAPDPGRRLAPGGERQRGHRRRACRFTSSPRPPGWRRRSPATSARRASPTSTSSPRRSTPTTRRSAWPARTWKNSTNSTNSEDKMNGWMGKMIKIDLGSGRQEDRPRQRRHAPPLPGRPRPGGQAVHRPVPGDRPTRFAADNALIFMTGPLTGTVMTSGRYQVVSRSPLTGTICDSSSGGSFGAVLKAAGLDGLVITGRADRPVYLYVHDGDVEVRDASALWGLDTQQTQKAVAGADDGQGLGGLHRPGRREPRACSPPS